MAVVMRSGEIRRYDANERLNHWAVAILFILLAASGLAFFHPAFWFLSALLGGGNWARILHPFLGVLMFALFLIMAMRYWDDNKIRPYDREWGKRLRDVIDNRDHDLPEIDKYNAGQKYLFWVMVATMVLLVDFRNHHVASVLCGGFPYQCSPHCCCSACSLGVHIDPGHHCARLCRGILGSGGDAGNDTRHGISRVGAASSSVVASAHERRQVDCHSVLR